MALRAVIAGATGLIGSNLAEHFVSKGWEVYGVARKPQTGIPGVRPIEADLLEREALRSSLAGSPGRPIVWHGDTPLNGGHKP
jgi:nucleoside-diphosphate-sugar epimerase